MGFGLNWVVLGTLFGFGIAYNYFVSRLNRRGWSEGYTAMLVVVGVSITVIGSIAMIGMTNALYMLAAFVASGLPMIAGDVLRHVRKREKQLESLRTIDHD